MKKLHLMLTFCCTLTLCHACPLSADSWFEKVRSWFYSENAKEAPLTIPETATNEELDIWNDAPNQEEPAINSDVSQEETAPTIAVVEVPQEEIAPPVAVVEVPQEEVAPVEVIVEEPQEEVTPPEVVIETPQEEITSIQIVFEDIQTTISEEANLSNDPIYIAVVGQHSDHTRLCFCDGNGNIYEWEVGMTLADTSFPIEDLSESFVLPTFDKGCLVISLQERLMSNPFTEDGSIPSLNCDQNQLPILSTVLGDKDFAYCDNKITVKTTGNAMDNSEFESSEVSPIDTDISLLNPDESVAEESNEASQQQLFDPSSDKFFVKIVVGEHDSWTRNVNITFVHDSRNVTFEIIPVE